MELSFTYFRLKLVYFRLEDEQKNKKFWEELIGLSVKLLRAFASTAILCSESRGTNGHIFLSHDSLPLWEEQIAYFPFTTY
jgi:hypothetical protein